MRCFSAIALCAALVLFPAAVLAAGQGGPWIHIHVTEDSGRGTDVAVNLPLSVIEVAMDAIPDHLFEEGRLELRNSDIAIEDLRRIWQELSNTGDAEFVTAVEGDERIRVFREGEHIHINVDDVDTGEQKVRIEVPVTVVDVLLAGEGAELNLRDAIAELSTRRGELVSVIDGDTQVRVWIDARN
jgi:hypothetical protein